MNKYYYKKLTPRMRTDYYIIWYIRQQLKPAYTYTIRSYMYKTIQFVESDFGFGYRIRVNSFLPEGWCYMLAYLWWWERRDFGPTMWYERRDQWEASIYYTTIESDSTRGASHTSRHLLRPHKQYYIWSINTFFGL